MRCRDAVSASNDQLLLTLTELVRANQRCEEVIARRLQALPIIGAEQNAAEANANLSQSTGSNAGNSRHQAHSVINSPHEKEGSVSD